MANPTLPPRAILAAVIVVALLAVLGFGDMVRPASAAPIPSRTYTLNADFDEGVYSNVVHSVPDQLQLDDTTTPFHFIWVAVSTKGTVVKINTDTGAVLGEYRTAPQGQPTDPSRTTVDLNGNVWNTNRAGHSVVHVGLKETGQCVDRNANGVIDTSTGLNDIRPWPNTGGADTGGGVSTAEDECILHYVLVNSSGTRHLSVTPDNNVWVSGTGTRVFQLLNGATGAILRTEGPVGYGGYGGLIDSAGVIWSSNPMLRWDTALPLSGPNGGNWRGYGHDSYGLCIDSAGNVWNSALSSNQIRKFAPNGTLIGTYGHGTYYAQGCTVDGNDHVWVAGSLYDNKVGHILNDGTFVGTVTVGTGPTGVAVDSNGKIWATNYYGGTASRIDPNAGPIGADGVTHVGAVDFTTVNLGGYLYNYSDMTGSTLIGAPQSGTWTVVFDSIESATEWGKVLWTATVPDGAGLGVTAASSADGITFSSPENVTQNVDLTVPDGRYLKVSVIFNRAPSGESPILYDLTVRIANQPPVVSAGGPYSGDEGADIPLDGASATDPDDDPLTYAWTYALGPGTDSGAICAFSDASDLNPSIACTDDGTYYAILTVSDGVNEPVAAQADVVVANVPPEVGITAPAWGALYLAGSAVDVEADLVDAGANDTHTCSVDWDDGSTSTGTVAESGGSGTCTAAHTFAGAGVYTVELAVTDDDGESDADLVMVIVYDPSAGFVTGGGTIVSPAGAYMPDATLAGHANFSVLAKYLKNATVPTGQTEFQFQAAGLNFHSTSYEWLVVAGARAQYRGSGTVNGTAGYGFLLTVEDGDASGGGGVDLFRMKIWDADGDVLYDNVPGASEDIDEAGPLPIESGSIVIH